MTRNAHCGAQKFIGDFARLRNRKVFRGLARSADGRRTKNSTRLLPITGPRWSFRGATERSCETLLRFLLGQAAQSVADSDEQWRHQYAHIAMRRNKAIARVAMARKLAVRLFWIWRPGWDYQQLKKFGSQGFHVISLAAGPKMTRRVARITLWCAVDHRTFDWAPRSLI